MRLGFFTYAERGKAERLMTGLAEALIRAGRPVAGLVAEPARAETCTRTVRLLPEGAQINIWQDLGPGATSCRLNPEALEMAVERARRDLDTAPEGTLVLINKFGKHEATDGGGTRGLIAAALEAGLPVLVPVPESALAAFMAFAGPYSAEIAADPAALAAFAELTLNGG